MYFLSRSVKGVVVTIGLENQAVQPIKLTFNAGINFIQNHPPPSGTRLEESKNHPPRDNHCVQKPFPRDKTGSQKPHPWDIKSKNFTNVSINSDTIQNEKLCGLNK